MTIPLAQGFPDQSALRTDVMSTTLLMEFFATSPIAQFTNQDWEGQIKEKGSNVKIPKFGDVVWRTYVAGSPIVSDRTTFTKIDFPIEQSKTCSIPWNVMDELWSFYKGNLSKLAELAMKTHAQEMTSDFFTGIYDDANASNKGIAAGDKTHAYDLGVTGDPVVLTTGDQAMALLAQCEAVLDEFYVPKENRTICLPSAFVVLLRQSNAANAAWTGDKTSIVRNGGIGRLCNFDVINTNQLYINGSSEVYIPFAHRDAVTFANQFTKTRQMSDVTDWDEYWQALDVYDWLTVKPKALGTACVKFTA